MLGNADYLTIHRISKKCFARRVETFSSAANRLQFGTFEIILRFQRSAALNFHRALQLGSRVRRVR